MPRSSVRYRPARRPAARAPHRPNRPFNKKAGREPTSTARHRTPLDGASPPSIGSDYRRTPRRLQGGAAGSRARARRGFRSPRGPSCLARTHLRSCRSSSASPQAFRQAPATAGMRERTPAPMKTSRVVSCSRPSCSPGGARRRDDPRRRRAAHARRVLVAGPQRVRGDRRLQWPTGLPSFADLAEAVAAGGGHGAGGNHRQPAATRGGNPFEFFFGPARAAPQGEPRASSAARAAGSGFVVAADGWIVTNHHVIDGATKVEVTFDDRDYCQRRGQGAGPVDRPRAAQGRRPTGSCRYLALGDSDALRVGDWVMAVGNPLLLEQSVTVGDRQRPRPQRARHHRPLVRELHPDRRRDQPRQLRRSAGQSRGRGGRHHHRHELRRREHRLLGAGQHAGGDRATSSRPPARCAAAISASSITNLDRDMAEAFGVGLHRRRPGAAGAAAQPGRRTPACATATSSSRSTASRSRTPATSSTTSRPRRRARRSSSTYLRNGKTMSATVTLEERPDGDAGRRRARPRAARARPSGWASSTRT